MSCHDRLELGQPYVAIRIGRAGLRRDPLQPRHPGVDVAGIGVDPAPQGGADLLIAQIRQQRHDSSPRSLRRPWGGTW